MLFAVVVLLYTTELHELAKLPVLLHHYQQHQQELVSFIQLHYNETTPNDPDADTDQQLPFKTHPGSVFNNFTDVIGHAPTPPACFPVLLVHNPRPLNNSILTFARVIFHPPDAAPQV